MTIVDIKNHLFSHFMSESTFSLKDDVASLKLNLDNVDPQIAIYKEALVGAALEQFVREGVIVPVGPASEGLYILSQPLNSFIQAVAISPLTAEMVSDLVNGLGDVLGSGSEEAPYVSNKTAITDRDIAMVAHICHMLLDEGNNGPVST